MKILYVDDWKSKFLKKRKKTSGFDVKGSCVRIHFDIFMRNHTGLQCTNA